MTQYLPPFDHDVITSRAEKIRATGKNKEGELRYIIQPDLFTTAYTWSPKFEDVVVGVDHLKDITTYHKYGHYVYFKPSIAEVIACIPEDLIDEVVAFEIIDRPENSSDLNDDLGALNAGFHVATARLYKKAV